ncbi:MAG: delta-60 repeat domain-containing protein [Opitutales bacterium]|nr:delta-60 repeat domain-containing protein [Opitutales bacterium]
MTNQLPLSFRPFFWGGFTAFALLLLFSAPAVSAQSPGDLDMSFETGSSVDNRVYAVAAADDGKVNIGGDFTTVRGAMRNRIARLNRDGTVDTSFDPGAGTNGSSSRVHSVTLQADSKVLIGGEFTSYNDLDRNRIARLHADGSLDTGFDPFIEAVFVSSIAVQVDGKVLLGGLFHQLQRYGA